MLLAQVPNSPHVGCHWATLRRMRQMADQSNAALPPFERQYNEALKRRPDFNSHDFT
jgi:hypothetical protein